MKRYKIIFLYGNRIISDMYSNLCIDNKWKDLELTDDLSLADFYIVRHNTIIKTDPNRTIVTEIEPKYLNLKMQSGSKYEMRLFSGLVWWIYKDFESLYNYKFDKNKNISSISSNKHKFRNDIIRKFDDIINIDTFGGSIKNLKYNNYKGNLSTKNRCKFSGIEKYKYHLVIENGKQKDYFTEKLADSFVCNSYPIYWGCPNILDYYPKESLFLLEPDLSNLNDAIHLIENPISDSMNKYLKEAKELTMYEYNLMEQIHKFINKIK